jgi:AT-rich DNA-binding protein
MPLKRIADSTVRRLSLYLRFLEEFENAGLTTVSSDELAARGGTTSAQVRKDLSFFGSFGKRGLGYQVAELTKRMRAFSASSGIGASSSSASERSALHSRSTRDFSSADSVW